MKRPFGLAWLGFAAILAPTSARSDDFPDSKPLTMTPAIACASVAGYDDYVPLPEAVVTADDKLLLYYRPLNHHVEKVGRQYRARLSVDGQVRRKNDKMAYKKKVDVIKSESTSKFPRMNLYFHHSVSLKGMPPGEYELEITLHDRTVPGSTAVQRVPFRIRSKKDEPAKPSTPAGVEPP